MRPGLEKEGTHMRPIYPHSNIKPGSLDLPTSKALKVSSSFVLFAQWLDQSLEKTTVLGF